MSKETPAGQRKQPVEAQVPAEWVWLRRTGEDVPEDEAPVRLPNDPAVLGHFEARGFEQVEDPPEVPWVQRPSDLPEPDEAPWVELVHPDLPADQVRRVPNDPAALQGAFDAGWQLPEQEEQGEQSKDQPAEKPAKRTKRASAEPADDQEE